MRGSIFCTMPATDKSRCPHRGSEAVSCRRGWLTNDSWFGIGGSMLTIHRHLKIPPIATRPMFQHRLLSNATQSNCHSRQQKRSANHH